MLNTILGLNLKKSAFLYRQLYITVKAGIGLPRTLASLQSRLKDGRWKNALREIKSQIEHGNTFYSACAKFPQIFSELELSLIKGGEISGKLDENLNYIANYLEKEYKNRIHLLTGLVYPVFLLHCAIIIPNILVGVLQGWTMFFINIFKSLGIFYSLIFLIYLIKKLVIDKMMKGTFDQIKLYLPIVGNLGKRLDIGRFIRALQSLYEAGIEIKQAWIVASNTCHNSVIKKRIKAAGSLFYEGKEVTQAFINVKIFPDAVIDMISIGEYSGGISEVLHKISQYYDEENQQIIKRINALLPVFAYLIIAFFVVLSIISYYKGYYNSIFSVSR